RLHSANLAGDPLHEICDATVTDATVGQLLHSIRFLVVINNAAKFECALPPRVEQIVAYGYKRLNMPGRRTGWPNTGSSAARRNGAGAIHTGQELVPDSLRSSRRAAERIQGCYEV